MERLLESGDVAKLAGVGPDAVRLWANNGALPAAAITLRGGRLFREADVERFLAARAERQAHRRFFGEGPGGQR
jgi:DNA-binding transcriptional MerR regulator